VIGHGRWRRRTALLAAGALEGGERAAAEAHASGCARCAPLLAGLGRLQDTLRGDGVGAAAPPLSFEALDARVRARLREPAAPRAAPAFGAGRTLPLAAALAVAVAGAALVTVVRTPPPPAVPPHAQADAAGPAAPDIDTEEMLRRMERTLAREQAARYLAEAQDVLVTVATGAPPCPKGRRVVEVGDEARRSRELLARRGLLVELGREEVASAGPVLAEVEGMLREVAALPSCVRPGRLQALERRMEQRQLLMKIDLMTRELVG
jgi:hypothetical protein